MLFRSATKLESDAELVAATTTAGETIFLCCNEEQNRTRNSLPLRPLQAELFSAALIPKFDPEIKNRCSLWAVLEGFLASIRKSGLEIKNHFSSKSVLQAEPFLTVAEMALQRFSSLGLKSRIDARKRPETRKSLHRFSSLGLKSRIDARKRA